MGSTVRGGGPVGTPILSRRVDRSVPSEVPTTLSADLGTMLSTHAQDDGWLDRQLRSKGSRQACGAMSWWMAFGPHDPAA